MTLRIAFVSSGLIGRAQLARQLFERAAEEHGTAGRFQPTHRCVGEAREGACPDPRLVLAARERHIELEDEPGIALTERDLRQSDVVVALDEEVFGLVQAMATPPDRDKLRLLVHYAEGMHSIPNPFFAGLQWFGWVVDAVEAGCRGLERTLAEEMADAGRPMRAAAGS
jgi:protein-tyrosine-phosphatase